MNITQKPLNLNELAFAYQANIIGGQTGVEIKNLLLKWREEQKELDIKREIGSN